jgi:hypothetical protein
MMCAPHLPARLRLRRNRPRRRATKRAEKFSNRVLHLYIKSSSLPNFDGVDNKRIIKSLSEDEFTWYSPSGIRTFSIPSGTPSCRRIGSAISGGTDRAADLCACRPYLGAGIAGNAQKPLARA